METHFTDDSRALMRFEIAQARGNELFIGSLEPFPASLYAPVAIRCFRNPRKSH
jgi:hypothetical protein